METQNDSLQGKRNEIRAKLKKDLRGALPGLITEYASLMVDFDFYHNADDLYNVLHNKDLPNEEKMTLAEPYWNKLSELKNRVGPELESSDLSDKKDQILEGIKTNAPKDAKEFQEVWQNLADMYALSNGLQVKLEPDGELRAFWDKLKGEYYSYPIRWGACLCFYDHVLSCNPTDTTDFLILLIIYLGFGVGIFAIRGGPAFDLESWAINIMFPLILAI